MNAGTSGGGVPVVRFATSRGALLALLADVAPRLELVQPGLVAFWPHDEPRVIA